MNEKFAVIVVTYNRMNLLKECLECIQRQKLTPYNVIIIDNHSTDGTENFLKNLPEIKESKWIWKRETQNLGGAGGFYNGMKIAMETDAEWFLLLDDDAMLAPDYLFLIAESIPNHPDIMAYSGTVLTDNQIIVDHRRRFNKVEIPVGKDEYNEKEFEYDLGSFCGIVVNRKVVDKVGYPEKDFFIWYDDTEYSFRIMALSKFVNVNKAILNHKTNIVIATSENKKEKINWKSYYGFRNVVYSYKKHRMLSFCLRYYILGRMKSAVKNYFDFSINKDVRRYNLQLTFTAIKDGLIGKLGVNELYKP